MAIIIERTITINNDKATLDKPIYFYVGDGNITCLFTIKEIGKTARFGKVNDSNIIQENDSLDYGEARIYKPNKDHAETTRAEIIGDNLKIEFNFDNIDEYSEAGVHKLQIHLYDNATGDRNRLTIPPIDINVLMPIGIETNLIDEAIVDYSLLDRAGEDVSTFINGEYNKTVWVKGDIITSNKLNKIEDALYEINAADSNFVTEDALEIELRGKADAAHKHPANNITGLARVATSGSYNDLSNKPNIPNTSNFATKTELAGKADATHSHDGVYATKAELQNIPNIPTRTSQLTNDSGFITSANVPTTTSQLVNNSGFITASDLPQIPTRTSQIINDSGYITGIPAQYITEEELYNMNFASQAFVTNKIAEAQLSGGSDGSGIDLSGYATKDDLLTKASVNELPRYTSQLTNDSGFITSIPLEYVTDAELSAKNYANKDYVSSAIESAQLGGDVDLSAYALKTDIPTNVSELINDINYTTESEVDSKIADALSNGDINVDLSNYATNTDVSNAITPINEAIDSINENLTDYAKKDDIPTILNDAGYITSSGTERITRIEIVTELPETEEEGVLYIVKG